MEGGDAKEVLEDVTGTVVFGEIRPGEAIACEEGGEVDDEARNGGDEKGFEEGQDAGGRELLLSLCKDVLLPFCPMLDRRGDRGSSDGRREGRSPSPPLLLVVGTPSPFRVPNHALAASTTFGVGSTTKLPRLLALSGAGGGEGCPCVIEVEVMDPSPFESRLGRRPRETSLLLRLSSPPPLLCLSPQKGGRGMDDKEESNPTLLCIHEGGGGGGIALVRRRLLLRGCKVSSNTTALVR